MPELARPRSLLVISCSLAALLGGCVTPEFDIPEKNGAPTVASITNRVTCELVDLVRKGGEFGEYRPVLLTGNYEVAVSLSLQVTDSGELSPSLSFPYPPLFEFGAGAKFMRSREQNYTQNLFFSMATLADQVDKYPAYGRCPEADTNLAGDLRIRNTVYLAMTASNRRVEDAKLDSGGEFGGYVNFVVTRNLNALGPTWTLTHFVGPGGLAGLSRVNTDKITFAFAPSKPPAAAKGAAPAGAKSRSKEFLNQLLLNQINSIR
jgi:hypothetical protein